MFTITIFHLLIILAFFFSFVAFVFFSRGRRPVSNILAWLFFIFLIPYLGIPLFLILGQRKFYWILQRKRELYIKNNSHSVPSTPLEEFLSTFGSLPATKNNHVDLLGDGITAYNTLVREIGNTQKSILISTYIFTNDAVGKNIIRLLTAKAASGVEICLLIDTFGNLFRFPDYKFREFRAAGGTVRYMMPILHMPFHGHANLRDHRKIMIFDGKTSIIGGMNIADEYMGEKIDRNRWTDISILIQGNAVRELIAIFESDWQFASSKRYIKSYHRPVFTEETYGNSNIQMVASGPDSVGDRLYDSILMLIFNAKQSIYIVTPYFIIDETLEKAIMIAIRRGVEVNIIVPRKSNHPLTDLARAISIKKLYHEGAKIWFYRKMLHAKLFVFDNTLAIVGSANFDLRSLLLNFEISCFISSIEDIQKLQNWINLLLPQCVTDLPKPSLSRTLLEDAAQLFKSLL